MNAKHPSSDEKQETLTDNNRVTVQTSAVKTTARERLWNQISASFDASVAASYWRCRVSGDFHQLWAQMCACVRARVQDLADLFEGLPKQWQTIEGQRLANIYYDILCPLVRKHFPEEQQVQLARSLRHLILLRLLDVPYRAGDPVEANAEVEALLLSLHKHCRGHGLMVWREGGTQVFVVETEQELYVNWVIRRMMAFLQRKHRDKTISDAIWATLFSNPDYSDSPQRCLLPASASGGALCVSGEHFPDREGITLKTSLSDTWALIFESPWEMDRGRRVRRAIQRLPIGVRSARVWIWEPRALTPAESQIVLAYIAAGRALRYALLEHTQGRGIAWVIDALRRTYISACPAAMKKLLDCFDEGIVISDGGVYTPRHGEERLVPTLKALTVWIHPVKMEGSAFHHEAAEELTYQDILPLGAQSYGLPGILRPP